MANDTIADAPERVREHRENRKKNMDRKVQANQAQAVEKYIRVPPRKARLVVDAVRGRYAMDALAFLRFIPNRAAGYISKALASAVANAANNHGLNPENLKLVEARIDEGPRLKRLHPRAQGRAYRILKRTSHITVIVEEVAPKPRKPRKVVAPTRSRAQAAREAKQPKPAAQPVAEPEVKTIATAEEVAPVVAEEPTPVVEATAPAAEETVTQEPQVANTEDTTDEIGAPVKPDAEDAP